MTLTNLKKRIYTSIVLFLLFLLIFKSNFILVYSLIVLATLSILEFLNITRKISRNKLFFLITNFFFITYVLIFCFLFFYFANFIQLKVILFSLIISCIASDVGGFVFGKIFKGPKLTKISPNKTIAGAIGSLLFSNLLFISTIFFFMKQFSYTFLIIATITSISCQFGDLLFSFLKRTVKIKDTGNFLPGHGGVLDRLDGIFVGIPVGFISIIYLF
jgi:phosphatidate cytidylyltransferase